MACQPANKPWLPDGVHPQPPKVAESEIVEKFLVEFNPGQALVDAADSSRSDIYYKDGDAPAVSSARSAYEGIVYRYVYFDGYKQDSMDLILNSGYMLFIINGNTAGTGKTGYTISVPEGLEIETLSGQVVSDFVVEDVSSTTAAITAVEVDGDKITITINEKEFSELPPSTTASTPGMNGESISKGELEEFTEIQIEPEDGVKNLDINSIIKEVLSNFSNNYTDGMSEISRELQQDNNLVKLGVQLDWYQAPASDYFINGKLNITFRPNDATAANRWEISSFSAESDGSLIVSDDNYEGYKISFENVKGTCSFIVTIEPSGDVKFSSEVKNITFERTSSFTVNGETITEAQIYGDGSVEHPFKVNSGEVLVSLFRETENYDKNFILTDDINLAELTWPVSAKYNKSFTGEFDGQGHAIRNLTIKDPGYNSFMKIGEGGIFENVKFENVKISIDNGTNLEYLSIFVENHGTISNVSVDEESIIDAIEPGKYHKLNIGGLVGYNGPTGVIENVSNAATIKFYFTERESAGGIAGVSAGKIENAVNTADIDAGESTDANIGGIVGTALKRSTINNAINEGSISVQPESKSIAAGGIVGAIGNARDNDGWDVSISNVINNGSISANSASGIAGEIQYSVGAIELSAVTNTGEVSGERVAGVVIGYGGTNSVKIIGAANNGTLTGSDSVAGIFNNDDGNNTVEITAAYSSGEIAGTASSKHGFALDANDTFDSCYYGGTEAGTAPDGVSYVDGLATTWQTAMDAMNGALSGEDFAFTLVNGVPALPEISITF